MTPSESSCSMPLRNCLVFDMSATRQTLKCSGAKLGIVGNVTGSSAQSVSPGPQRGGVDQPDDVAGERLLDGRAVAAEHRLRVLGGERAPRRVVGEHHAALEATRADAHERDPVAVRLVHRRLHLEHQARERRVDRTELALLVGARSGRRGQLHQRVEQAGDADVRQRGPEHHRRRGAGVERPRGRTRRRSRRAARAPRWRAPSPRPPRPRRCRRRGPRRSPSTRRARRA